MFRRDEHRAVLHLLEALDAGLLESHHAWFGGGTRLVLELGEYRLSKVVDFLCSDARAFAELRSLTRQGGAAALFSDESPPDVELPREVRADQYGVRFPLVASGLPLKVEIIREGRIALDPGVRPTWSPITCLARSDAYAEKLLSNSDRWPDRQVLARDVIDLGMLRSEMGPIPEDAWAKAEGAYGALVRRDLKAALAMLLDDSAFQRRCFGGLAVTRPQEVLDGVAHLLADLGERSGGDHGPAQ